LALPPEADVLELGAGGGANAAALLNRFPGWRMTVTDVDPDMVALASARLARFGERARLSAEDAGALAFADASFDVVISLLTWHHVSDPDAAAREVRRVLRPAGQFVFADVYGHGVFGPCARWMTPVRRYTRQQLLDSLTEAGLRVERIRSWAGIGCALVARRQ
jgi:ubiquinone/menaquinone biosynthesis C-methylase UbiE